MFVVESAEVYQKKLKRFLQKHPDMKGLYEKTIWLLSRNPFHPSLRLHKFSPDRYSVSVNMSYRIALDIKFDGDRIILFDIGTHREVYGKG